MTVLTGYPKFMTGAPYGFYQWLDRQIYRQSYVRARFQDERNPLYSKYNDRYCVAPDTVLVRFTLN